MKVSEIIFEAPAPSGPVPAGMTWNGTMWVPAGTPSAPTPKPKKTPKERSLENILKRARAKVRKSRADLDAAEKKYNKAFGTGFKWLFRFAGLTVATVELYATLEEIDDIYRNEPDVIQTDADYNALRELAFGTYQVAVLAPVIANVAVRLARSILFLNWIKRIAALASAPITGGLSVGAMLATEVGVAWFQSWIASKEGQDWIADSFFMTPIRTFGKVGNNIADALSMAYTKAMTGKAETNLDQLQQEPLSPSKPGGRKPRKDNEPEGQGGQVAPQDDQSPASRAAYTTDIRMKVGNTILVGGQAVTDEKGYLIPSRLQMFRVQSARETALRRGQPDPIEGIPQKPGEPKVEIMKPETT